MSLIDDFARQYGYNANWNALRGGNDPLIQQFGAQYGADTNWNAFRPSGAPAPTPAAPTAGGGGPISNAPATLSQASAQGQTQAYTAPPALSTGNTADLVAQMNQLYGGTANWNALRGGTDPLIQQFAARYGADTNWNAFRGATGAGSPSGLGTSGPPPGWPDDKPWQGTGGGTPQTTAPTPTGSNADLLAQMQAKYANFGNWNALRGSSDPLVQQFAAAYGADTNWNAYRTAATAAGTGGGGGTQGATTNPQYPDFKFDYKSHQADPNAPVNREGAPPGSMMPSLKYDDYVKKLTDAGFTPELAKSQADSYFMATLSQAMQYANTAAYGRTQHADQSYWLDMWKKDPEYTWRRLFGEGAGGADKPQYGPYSGLAGGGGGGGTPTPPAATAPPPAGGTNANNVLNSPLLAPWTTQFNYEPFSSTHHYVPPDPFKPPTEQDLYTDPGYQSRVDEGRKQLQRAASAKGALRNPATARQLDEYAQDYAANEYQDLYARRLNEYLTGYNANLQDFQTLYGTDLNDWMTNYNKALQEYQQQYNIFEQNQAKQFNRIAALAGLGQTAAGNLGSFGMNYGSNIANTLLGAGNMLGNYYSNVANANAAAQIARGNTYQWLFR